MNTFLTGFLVGAIPLVWFIRRYYDNHDTVMAGLACLEAAI